MKIEESSQANSVMIDCQVCQRMFPVEDFRSGDLAELIRNCYEHYRVCPACEEYSKQQQQQQEAAQRKEELKQQLPELLTAAGIEYFYCHDRQTGEIFKKPPCRYVAEWIYRNRHRNLLVSGVTGSGKSTSACFIASGLICEGKRVRYTSLRKLLSRWKEAKTSDQINAVDRMLGSIFSQDVFIIDEVVGKARISESGQELLFEILESVNSGGCRARIWLLGNFYEGSIEDIFDDADPIRRRLQENFCCAVADPSKQTVTPITVWQE